MSNETTEKEPATPPAKTEEGAPKAEAGAAQPGAPEGIPEGLGDTKLEVVLEFDMLTNALVMKSKAPTVMLMGILNMALSMITQNQTMQRIQRAAAATKLVDRDGRPLPPQHPRN